MTLVDVLWLLARAGIAYGVFRFVVLMADRMRA